MLTFVFTENQILVSFPSDAYILALKMYFKAILTSISLEFFNQHFIPLASTEKERYGLSISEFDIESIATPTPSATTEQPVGYLLDLFQWDHSPTETQSNMDIEDAIANMKRGKEGTATTFHNCSSSQEKEKNQKEQEN